MFVSSRNGIDHKAIIKNVLTCYSARIETQFSVFLLTFIYCNIKKEENFQINFMQYSLMKAPSPSGLMQRQSRYFFERFNAQLE